MGAAVAFDRSEVIRQLEARGFEHDKAIGIADVLQNHVLPHAASKRGEASARGRLTSRLDAFQADLSGLKTDLATLRVELGAVRGEIRNAINEAKNSLLLWLFPVLFGQVAAIAALVKMF